MEMAATSACIEQKIPSGESGARGARLACPILFLLLIFTLAGFCRAAPAHAQWTGIGPDGGNVTSLVINPSIPQILYAGTDNGGVYKSTSGGLAR